MGIETEYGISAPGAPDFNPVLSSSLLINTYAGSLRRIRNDVGIVRAPNGAYAVAIFTRELVRDNVDDERAIAAMSLAVYEALAG